MEVVKGRARLVLRVGVGDGHVRERAPFPHHMVRGDVDLLHDRVEHGAVRGTAYRGEVRLHRRVHGHERVALRRDTELVLVDAVALVPGPRGDLVDLLVLLIQHDPHAVARVGRRDQPPLPVCEDRLSAIGLHALVECRRAGSRAGGRMLPQQIAVLVQYVRAVLPGVLGIEEDVARRCIGVLLDQLDDRRMQVRR